jgi:hypothetical protein
MTNKVGKELCEYCGMDTAIRNPSGNCDHLYYPENVNKEFTREKVGKEKGLMFKLVNENNAVFQITLDNKIQYFDGVEFKTCKNMQEVAEILPQVLRAVAEFVKAQAKQEALECVPKKKEWIEQENWTWNECVEQVLESLNRL